MKDPFATRILGQHCALVSAADRIDRVKKMTIDECEAALQIHGHDMQKTVERAIERRMRVLRTDADSVSTHYAWCWADGLLEIGPQPPLPDDDGGGVIVVARGRKSALELVLGALARIGYDDALLVPGVPEASNRREAIDALGGWVDWCSAGNGRKDRKGVVFGRNLLENSHAH